jgi:Mrp family chromosome partitioning ATPase
LTGNVSFSEIIRNLNIPNLTFIFAGTLPPGPTELLESEAFKDLLQEARKEFNHVIIDTPPVIDFADGRVFSNVVDGVIGVLKQDVTSGKAGLLAIQLLLQVNPRIIGGVLNMSKNYRMGRYYYNYGKQSKYLSYYYR